MLLELSDLAVSRNGALVIDGLSARFEGPGLYQIIGPNGAGKTTLLLAILGLVKPHRGRVLLDGVDVTGNPGALYGRVGYMPQLADSRIFETPITPWELVDCCARLYSKWPRLGRSRRELVERALREAGIPEELWHIRVGELSGGMRQRVLLARALVPDPPILLLDEPEANIDPSGRFLLAEHLGKISSKKLVLVTSHDPALFLKWTKGILAINKRVYAFGSPERVLAPDVLTKIYGLGWVAVEKHAHVYDSHR